MMEWDKDGKQPKSKGVLRTYTDLLTGSKDVLQRASSLWQGQEE